TRGRRGRGRRRSTCIARRLRRERSNRVCLHGQRPERSRVRAPFVHRAVRSRPFCRRNPRSRGRRPLMRAILVGLGAVGQGLLSVLESQGPVLIERYGLRTTIVAAVDTSGAVVRTDGIAPLVLLDSKRSPEGLA